MGNNDIDREYLPTSAWVRERTDEFARVRMKLARHIALVSKEGSGERVKVPTAADEKGEARIHHYFYLAEIPLLTLGSRMS